MRFYVFNDAGRASFSAAASVLASVLEPGEPLEDLIERIADLDFEWGTRNGN